MASGHVNGECHEWKRDDPWPFRTSQFDLMFADIYEYSKCTLCLNTGDAPMLADILGLIRIMLADEATAEVRLEAGTRIRRMLYRYGQEDFTRRLIDLGILSILIVFLSRDDEAKL